MFRTTRLESGLSVVTETMPAASSVTAGFWVGTGSRDEEPVRAGASHFLEHLLFKGTPRRAAADIAEAIDAVGGDMNAFTTKEYTAFYVRVLSESTSLALGILCDVMTDPAFRAPEVESERQVILEEILMHGDDPADLVHDVLLEAAYPEHPLGREVLGDETTITAMSSADIDVFFRRHYRPANMVMAAAGAVDHDHLVGLVEELMGDRQTGGDRPERRAPASPTGRVAVVERPTEQANVAIAWPTGGRHHPDRYSLAVLDQILGGGLSSRLFQEIRERHGLAYSVYSYRASFDDTGLLAVYAGTAPDHLEEVAERMHAEVARIRDGGVTDRELAVAKGHVRGETALSLEDSSARMSRIGRSLLLHGEVLPVEEILSRVEAVTVDDVGAVAHRVLSGEPVTAVVGPFEEGDLAWAS